MLEIPQCCQTFYRCVVVHIGFGTEKNTASEQHVTFSVLYISLPLDWLSCFGFLLTHGFFMGNSVVLFFTYL